MTKTTIVTLSGPTCAGKTFLAEFMLQDGAFDRIITATTRAPRAGEVNGQHYHFLSHTMFESLDRRGLLLEKTNVSGKYYGIPLDEVNRIVTAGQIPIAIVDPAGVSNILNFIEKEKQEGRLSDWDVFSVYLDVPQELRLERFLTRFKEDEKADPRHYARRLNEIFFEEQDWPTRLTYDFVLNTDTQEAALEAVRKIAQAVSARNMEVDIDSDYMLSAT